MTTLIVLTTTDTRAKAEALCQALVERRVAACAQISEIDSWFRWDGAVQHEPEFRVLLKTTEARYAALEAALIELHDYEVPALVALPVRHAYGPFAAWVAAETGR